LPQEERAAESAAEVARFLSAAQQDERLGATQRASSTTSLSKPKRIARARSSAVAF
jgi:hypothetical protein